VMGNTCNSVGKDFVAEDRHLQVVSLAQFLLIQNSSCCVCPPLTDIYGSEPCILFYPLIRTYNLSLSAPKRPDEHLQERWVVIGSHGALDDPPSPSTDAKNTTTGLQIRTPETSPEHRASAGALWSVNEKIVGQRFNLYLHSLPVPSAAKESLQLNHKVVICIHILLLSSTVQGRMLFLKPLTGGVTDSRKKGKCEQSLRLRCRCLSVCLRPRAGLYGLGHSSV
jgi:hypothetical protein